MERAFNPCILQQGGSSVNLLSPSKLLNLSSPLPRSLHFTEHKQPPTISKKLFFSHEPAK